MASISISIDNGATVRAHMTIGNPCMSIYVSCDIPPSYAGGNPIPYGRDDLMIHGSPAEIAAFAHAILAAIPQEPRVDHSHTKDSDCTIDPETGCCFQCGVSHDEECPECGNRAFHSVTCWLVDNGNTHHTRREGVAE